MRLFAVHDVEGRIYEVVTCPADGPVPVLETRPGLVVSEVEPPEEVTEDADLHEFIRNHRVQAAPQQKSSVVRLETPEAQ